jgi:hypothetical protein
MAVTDEGDILLACLRRSAGFQPADAVRADHAARMAALPDVADADGLVTLAGELEYQTCRPTDFAVASFNADGTLDRAFDADGRMVSRFTCDPSAQITAAGFDAAGRFLAAGSSDGSPALARYAWSAMNERLWATHDANYNITAVTDSYGYVVERYEYDPYGARTIMYPWFEESGGEPYGCWQKAREGGPGRGVK